MTAFGAGTEAIAGAIHADSPEGKALAEPRKTQGIQPGVLDLLTLVSEQPTRTNRFPIPDTPFELELRALKSATQIRQIEASIRFSIGADDTEEEEAEDGGAARKKHPTLDAFATMFGLSQTPDPKTARILLWLHAGCTGLYKADPETGEMIKVADGLNQKEIFQLAEQTGGALVEAGSRVMGMTQGWWPAKAYFRTRRGAWERERILTCYYGLGGTVREIEARGLSTQEIDEITAARLAKEEEQMDDYAQILVAFLSALFGKKGG